MLATLVNDPLTRLVAQVVAVVAVSRLLGVLVRRLGQPNVIAEITAGILLGPSFLGLVAPDFTAHLFAPESLGVMHLLSQLGLMLFMFLVGLELDPELLRGRGRASVMISWTSIVVPFGLGAGLAYFLYPRVSAPSVPFSAFALFLGIAMTITAFPVLARILIDRQLLRSRVGAVAIACAAVDDVTAWCMLAFVVAAARANGLQEAVLITAITCGYIALMLGGVRPLLRRLGRRVANRDGLSQNTVALLMLLLFLSSWATELIGIHSLFGAFLLGAILPKEGGLAQALAEKLEDVVLVVLLPLFFAYSGLRTEIGLLYSPAAWTTCGVLVLVACTGKLAGSAVAARLTGLSWRESGAIGILMNTRGLMELIVLNIGLDLGVLSPTLFTMMVVMALVTTFLTTPILNLVYPPEQLAKDLLIAAGREHAVAEVPRRFGVLVCVAHDRSGPGLLSMAHALGAGGPGAEVHALHLLDPSDRASFYLQMRADGVDPVLAPLVVQAQSLTVEVKPMSFVSAEPADDICRVADVKGVDLLLMGWHKPVLSQSLLGGTVDRVLEQTRVEVAIFFDRGLSSVTRVLVPFIGMGHDYAALATAKRLLGSGAEVTILHVKDPHEEQAPAGAHALADQVFAEPAGGRVTMRVVYDEAPIDALLCETRAGYDLVVVGLEPEWGLERGYLAGQPELLLRESPASVLIVRGRVAPQPATVTALSAARPALRTD